jgi:hypothetical protein
MLQEYCQRCRRCGPCSMGSLSAEAWLAAARPFPLPHPPGDIMFASDMRGSFNSFLPTAAGYGAALTVFQVCGCALVWNYRV